MKKTIAIISLIIAFFVIYFLQTNFFTWFTINGIMPNLFVILVLFIGLFAGRKLGFAFGIVFGLILDLLLGRTIGVSAFLLAIIGLVSEYLDKSFSKDSRIMIIITTIAGTIFFEVGYYIFINGMNSKIAPNLIILTIILYPIIQNAGNRLEDIFKNKKVLSRYY